MAKVRRSAKVLLSHKQILELMDVTIDILIYLIKKRENIQDSFVSDSLKNIQVPVRLSESIALRLLRGNQIYFKKHAPVDFKYGSKRGDFDIENYNGNKKLKIEVKATGSDVFQRFREHALKSDVTIWIDFYGLREENISSKIKIIVLPTKRIRDARKKGAKEKEMDVTKTLDSPFNGTSYEYDIRKSSLI